MIVYTVMYGPGEPDGVYTIAICATRDRAEQEINRLSSPNDGFYDHENLFIEEEEVLE